MSDFPTDEWFHNFGTKCLKFLNRIALEFGILMWKLMWNLSINLKKERLWNLSICRRKKMWISTIFCAKKLAKYVNLLPENITKFALGFQELIVSKFNIFRKTMKFFGWKSLPLIMFFWAGFQNFGPELRFEIQPLYSFWHVFKKRKKVILFFFWF